jgi:predicted nucleic acid-binding protein
MAPTTPNHFLIADSSGLVSLVSTADINHQAARRTLAHLEQTPCTIIVPGDIFTETINTLNKIGSYRLAADTCAYLAHTPPFLLNDVFPEIRRDAVARFHAHGNGSLSFADWIVLAVADAFETTEIFGFDDGMNRQGYTILPPEEAQEAA